MGYLLLQTFFLMLAAFFLGALLACLVKSAFFSGASASAQTAGTPPHPGTDAVFARAPVEVRPVPPPMIEVATRPAPAAVLAPDATRFERALTQPGAASEAARLAAAKAGRPAPAAVAAAEAAATAAALAAAAQARPPVAASPAAIPSPAQPARPSPQPAASAPPAAAAKVAAAAGPPPPLSAPAPPQDLTRIRAIEAGLARRLGELGVTRYEQIAGWSAKEVARVSSALGFKGRVQKENWIEQAQILARGAETAYARQRAAAATAASVQGVGQLAVPKPATPAAAGPRPAAPAAPPAPNPAAAAPAPRPAPGQPPAAAPTGGPAGPTAKPTAALVPPTTTPAPARAAEPAAAAATPGAPAAVQQPARPGPSAAPASGPATGSTLPAGGSGPPQQPSTAPQAAKAGSSPAAPASIPVTGAAVQPGASGSPQPQKPPASSTPSATAVPQVPPRPQSSAPASAAASQGSVPAVGGTPPGQKGAPPAAPSAPPAAAPASSQPRAPEPRPGRLADALREARAGGDDLKRIRGIGVLVEKKLNGLGVDSYAQVASWTGADVERVSRALDLAGRIERESWIEQARILAAGGHTEFSRLFDRGENQSSTDS